MSSPSSELIPLATFNDAPVDRITAHFIGRDSELAAIKKAFGTIQNGRPTRYAVHGMPGLGKSQLALQYSNVAFEQGCYSHVFWVSATTVEKLNQGFMHILDLAGHPDRFHPQQSAKLTAARRWLEESDQYGCMKWLLIFDNVEEESLSFLQNHLPRKNILGNILFTTKTQNIAEAVVNAAGQQHSTVELKPLSPENSMKLLFAKASVNIHVVTDIEKNKAEGLVKQMGCLPLAVDQAGSYMNRFHKGVGDLQKLCDSEQMMQVSCQ